MRYFTYEEFDSPDLIDSGRKMQDHFLERLDIARHLSGRPFHVGSGYRTTKHNKVVGGKEDSSHLTGVAADIDKIRDSNDRFLKVKAALDAGFRRIGIGDTFIHLDSDEDKPQDVLWLY